MCEGETKREIKDNNEINQCLKEILNTCNSEDEEVDDKYKKQVCHESGRPEISKGKY